MDVMNYVTTGITSIFINRIDLPPAFANLGTNELRARHKLSKRGHDYPFPQRS